MDSAILKEKKISSRNAGTGSIIMPINTNNSNGIPILLIVELLMPATAVARSMFLNELKNDAMLRFSDNYCGINSKSKNRADFYEWVTFLGNLFVAAQIKEQYFA